MYVCSYVHVQLCIRYIAKKAEVPDGTNKKLKMSRNMENLMFHSVDTNNVAAGN